MFDDEWTLSRKRPYKLPPRAEGPPPSSSKVVKVVNKPRHMLFQRFMRDPPTRTDEGANTEKPIEKQPKTTISVDSSCGFTIHGTSHLSEFDISGGFVVETEDPEAFSYEMAEIRALNARGLIDDGIRGVPIFDDFELARLREREQNWMRREGTPIRWNVRHGLSRGGATRGRGGDRGRGRGRGRGA